MPTRIALEEAISLLTESVQPLGRQALDLEQLIAAPCRTLADDLTAPISQPPFDRSPLDGYALRSADVAHAGTENPVRLVIVDTVYAGVAAELPIGQGQAARITTGAVLPTGADCVIRQEDTDYEEDMACGTVVVTVSRPLSPGENIVERGADYCAGQVLLRAGTRLDAAALGVLASAGLCSGIPVYRRPAVGVLSTGDELMAPSATGLPPGKIYGANGTMLSARLVELGIREVQHQMVGDDPGEVAEGISSLIQTCDLIITTGGVSVGARDGMHAALKQLGAQRIFWCVQVKPGTPACFSLYQGKPVLSLSGNPFAAVATFELLARPLLAALTCESHFLLRPARAVLTNAWNKGGSLRRFIRGKYADGTVTLPGGESPGLLSSYAGCNCLVDVAAGRGPIAAGEQVPIFF